MGTAVFLPIGVAFGLFTLLSARVFARLEVQILPYTLTSYRPLNQVVHSWLFKQPFMAH